MIDFLFRRKKSANSAKERLQLVLIHDRTDLTPAQLEALKDDLDRDDLTVYRDRSVGSEHQYRPGRAGPAAGGGYPVEERESQENAMN